MSEDLMQRLALTALQDRYVATIDNDRLEDWPGLFVEDCLYEIVSKENEDGGFPAPVIHCDNARMLRDRVLALRNANIFEKPQYRHCLSGMAWGAQDGGFWMRTSYVVVNTWSDGHSGIYQAGLYLDRVVDTGEGLRFRSKRCIYDTLRVQTVLAYPI